MHILIVGAGEIGKHVAEYLSEQHQSVVVVESDEVRAREIAEILDVKVLCGHGTDINVLESAGVQGADLVLAVSNSDEVNLVVSQLAKKLGAKRTIVRARRPFYLEEDVSFYAKAFDVDKIICPEVATAMEIARIVEHPGSLDVTYFAQGKIQMRRIIAEAGSKGVERSLRDLSFPSGALIAGITREDQVIIPRGDDKVYPGDTVTIIGNTKDIGSIQRIFRGEKEVSRNITIAGGGLIGLKLAQILENRGYKVVIVDKNPSICDYLAKVLEKSEVLHGDITNLEFVEEMGIGKMDAFVAATSHDEVNLVSSLLMRQLGVSEIVTVVNRSDFAPVVRQSGLAHALSPRLVMASTVKMSLQRKEISSIRLLDDGRIEVIELRIPKYAVVAGKTLKEINPPSGTIIAVIVRHSDIIVPRGMDVLEAGDTVVAFAKTDMAQKLEEMLTRT